MDEFSQKLASLPYIRFIHPLAEQSWGQRCVRFYDPDGHIIEVGESMANVVKSLAKSGLSIEAIAKRMDVDAGYIKAMLER